MLISITISTPIHNIFADDEITYKETSSSKHTFTDTSTTYTIIDPTDACNIVLNAYKDYPSTGEYYKPYSSLTQTGGAYAVIIGGAYVSNVNGSFRYNSVTNGNVTVTDSNKYPNQVGGAILVWGGTINQIGTPNSGDSTQNTGDNIGADTTKITTYFTGNSVITSNSIKQASGGAISIFGHTKTSKINTISNTRFENNYVSNTNGKSTGANANGGAIHIYNATLEKLDNVEFKYNFAYVSSTNQLAKGGAISVLHDNSLAVGEISIKSSTFDSNYVNAPYATAQGGAIYNQNENITITNSSFNGNHADGTTAQGGAIYTNSAKTTNNTNPDASITITNSTFTDNYAYASSSNGKVQGGAIYTNNNLIINANNNGTTTFSGNYVQTVGGEKDYNALYFDSTSTSATLTLNATSGGTITFDDNINGKDGYRIAITGDGSEDSGTTLNNVIKGNANVTIENTNVTMAKNAHYVKDDGETISYVKDSETYELTSLNNKSGSLNIDSTATINIKNAITNGEQGSVNNPATIANSGTITASSLTNAGTITGATAEGITTYGDLTIGDGTNFGTITQNNVTISGTFNNYISNTNGTITASSITNSGTLTTNASNISATNGITNTNNLTLTGGKLKSAISGTGGTTYISGNVTNTSNKTISQNVTITADGSLSTNIDNLTGAITNNNELTITGGTLAAAISGNGTTVIDGFVSLANSGSIANAIEINTNKTLSSNASKFGSDISGTITNNGKIELTGGELTYSLAGNVEIKSGATVSATNSKFTGSLNNLGTYNISDDLNKNILGSGTTVLQNANTSVIDGTTIVGTLDANNKTIAMSDSSFQTLDVGNFKGNGNLSIDVNVTNNNGKATANDKINITNGTNNGGVLNLTSINVLGSSPTAPTTSYSDFINYVTGYNSNITYKLQGSEIGTYSYDNLDGQFGRTYRFTLGSNNGSLDMSIENDDLTLYEFITGTNDRAKGINTYSINNDYSQTGDIGVVAQRLDGSKILNINLNDGHDLTATGNNTANGITILDGFTLDITGSTNYEDPSNKAIMSNFNTALTNSGTLNVNNIVFANNTTDIDNNGVLNFIGSNTLNKITGNGSATNSGTLNISASGLGNTLDNSGSLYLGNGDLASAISGSGSTTISGNVTNTNSKTIGQNVTVATGGSLSTNADKVTGAITNNNQLTLTGGTVQNTITGGNTNITGTTSSAVDRLVNTAINNSSTLTLTGNGDLASAISGNGSTTISGNVTNTNSKTIKQNVTVATGGSLSTDADKVTGAITNNSTLNFTGGTSALDIIQTTPGAKLNLSNNTNLTLGANSSISGGLVEVSTDPTEETDKSTLNIGTQNIGTQSNVVDAVTFNNSILNLAINSSAHGTIYAKDFIIDEYSTLNIMIEGALSYGEYQLIKADNYSNLGTFTFSGNNKYKVIDLSNGLFKILANKTAAEISAENGGTLNNIITASAWESPETFSDETSKNIAQKLEELSQADGREFNRQLTNLAPSVAPVTKITTLNNINKVFSATDAHLSDDYNNRNHDDVWNKVERTTIWLKVINGEAKLNNTSKYAGFNTTTQGVVMGLDNELSGNAKVGFGYSYLTDDVKMNNRQFDINENTLFAYGTYKPSSYFFSGNAALSFGNFDEKKQALGQTISDKYQAQTLALQVKAGKEIKFNDTTFTPEVGMRYYHIDREDYKDTANQSVEGQQMNVLTGLVGFKVAKDINVKDLNINLCRANKPCKNLTANSNMIIKPEFGIRATYDIASDKENPTITLTNGSKYRFKEEQYNRFGIETNFSISLKVNSNADISFGYDGNFREHYQDHSGSINFKYNF